MALTLCVLLLLAAITSGAENFEPDNKVVYKTVGDVTLRLHIFNPPHHSTDESRPAVVFLFGGGWVGGTPSHFYPHSSYLASRGYGHDCVKERWREFSPMHNIDKDMPPTIVFIGTKDRLIPMAAAEKYKYLMEKSGGRCELFLYEGQPHGFFNHPFYRGESDEYYKKTCIEMGRFLKSLGYLEGPHTLK